jgi:hypothetical protein
VTLLLHTSFWRLMPKGEWSYLFMCLWNNELVFVFGT